LRKQELIFKILQVQAEKSGLIFQRGRARMPARRIRIPARARVQLSARSRTTCTFAVADPALRSAHRRHVSGQIRPPKEGERYFALIKVDAINFEPPEEARNKIFFDNLTPLYPQSRFKMETAKDNFSVACWT
jgi:transcription termination factor Rho